VAVVFPAFLWHGLDAIGASTSSPTLRVVTLLQLGLSALVCVGGYWAIHQANRGRRPGDVIRLGLRFSAALIVMAVVMIGLGQTLQTFLGSMLPSAGDAVLLSPALILLAAVLMIPRTVLKDAQRQRMLVDGLMIMAGAATFAWYFVFGPALSHHWSSTAPEITALAYPWLDLVLVGTLLVLSAKSARLPKGQWWSLPAGITILIVSDAVRELALQTNATLPTQMAPIARLIASGLLAVSAIQLLRFRDKGSTSRGELAGPDESFGDRESSPRTLPQPSHIWDSLLPYALVPAAAALAAYAWQTKLPSDVTGGVLAGTFILVALTFCRQLLALKENRRLYEQVSRAYAESLNDSVRMEVLNEELERTKMQLQAKNDALASANLSLQAQAITDPLTGLSNHRSMVLALDQELDRAARYARPCSLLFLDLDHFKAFNDSCGHLAGNSVLRELVTPILDGLRTADIAGRWGGEEFVVILPETEIGDAILAAERIRNLVSRHSFSTAGGAHITCSIGVAAFPYDAGSRDELVEAADRAMYAAKRLGKNQVRAAVDPSVIAFHSDVRHASSREESSLWGTVEALTTIVKAHDPEEDAQSKEVAKLTMRVATVLGLSAAEVRMVGLAARLHDVGMVSVPRSVLSKAAALNSEDWSSVISHPAIGAEVVASVPSLSMLSPLIRSHHEWWDGSGYPDGLKGDDIPMGGRIIAVCAAYLAITSGNRRTSARTMEEALQELHRCAGSQFDPAVVAVLHQVVLTPPIQAEAKAS
jgi:two-component system, cell cycle response regulator